MQFLAVSLDSLSTIVKSLDNVKRENSDIKIIMFFEIY
jgi:hypothetical protein